MEYFGKICMALILMVLSVCIGGFVFIKLYDWFIISTFKAPKITFAKALGIMLFVGYFKPNYKKDEEKFSIKKIYEKSIEKFIKSFVILCFGYLIIKFI
jgi:hypothetical protein